MKDSLRLALAALTLVALLAVACSPRDDTDNATATESPAAVTPAGDETATPAPDDRSPVPELPGPLSAILSGVADVRELEPPESLNAEVVARDDVPALLDELTTDSDREMYRNTTTLYRLLGHFDLDQDYEGIFDSFGADAILGLYSPARDTLWVVSDSGDLDDLSERERRTLAHELIHALQDYHFDLDAVYEGIEGNLDRELAWTAVIEGDAEVHEAAFGGGGGSISTAAGVLLLEAEARQIGGVPQSFFREMFFPYQTGSTWARTILEDGGVDAINDFLANPPAGTSVILHPELIEAGWQPREVSVPDLAGALGDGWERQSGGTLGEFRWMNYLQMEVPGVTAADAAKGWNGDAYDVYVNGDESAALFRIAFSDASEAEAFREAHLLYLEEAGVTASGGLTVSERANGMTTAVPGDEDGTEVVFAIGSSSDLAIQVMETLISG